MTFKFSMGSGTVGPTKFSILVKKVKGMSLCFRQPQRLSLTQVGAVVTTCLPGILPLDLFVYFRIPF